MPPPPHPIRVAFVGAGNMARTHLGALSRVQTQHIVTGVYDVSGPAAEAFAADAGPGAKAYTDLGALFAVRPDVVHICTPAGMHYQPARDALLAGAHVYIEKPFVETLEEAESLLELARQRGLTICAGHQLLRDRPFVQLMGTAAGLRPITQLDSNFLFRSPTLTLHRASPRAIANQLLDILPHPLYTLIAALNWASELATLPELLMVQATPTDIQAVMRQGDVIGRLSVSLRARPVASTLSLTGERGTLTADFVRGMVVGAGNDGTSPIEKIGNPFVEGAQLVWRTTAGLVRRFSRGGGYGGLVELINDFYRGTLPGGTPPITPAQLRTVAALYEHLAAAIRDATPRSATNGGNHGSHADAPVAVLTGASGFLGRELARELKQRGFQVRGVGRGERPEASSLDEWIRADLSKPISPTVLEEADIVVHAAAETRGGFPAHQCNTIDATQHLLDAMGTAGIRRLVLVSSLSVVEPPRSPWEKQDEETPLAKQPERLGAYTWGKVVAEQLVVAAQQAGRIDARIVRPGALFDAEHIELPGLLGRHLFGRWHLGLGRAGLPLPACDVRRAAQVLAWCAAEFESAPAVMNLFDPQYTTRGELLASWRERGWSGRMVWVPISLLAGLLHVARMRSPQPLSAWSILRPRRFDATVARRAFEATRPDR